MKDAIYFLAGVAALWLASAAVMNVVKDWKQHHPKQQQVAKQPEAKMCVTPSVAQERETIAALELQVQGLRQTAAGVMMDTQHYLDTHCKLIKDPKGPIISCNQVLP